MTAQQTPTHHPQALSAAAPHRRAHYTRTSIYVHALAHITSTLYSILLCVAHNIRHGGGCGCHWAVIFIQGLSPAETLGIKNCLHLKLPVRNTLIALAIKEAKGVKREFVTQYENMCALVKSHEQNGKEKSLLFIVRCKIIL
jgi:hypothetical protein